MPGLLSVKQVCLLLNKTKSWVYEKVQRGTMPYVYLDGSTCLDPVRLAAWLNAALRRIITHRGSFADTREPSVRCDGKSREESRQGVPDLRS